MRVYEASSTFPSEEKYGLTSQIRRSAVSIPSNIAEGAGRNSSKEFSHFLGVARGSSYELQTQIIISKELNLIPEHLEIEILQLIEEVQKMIYGFQQSLVSDLTSKI